MEIFIIIVILFLGLAIYAGVQQGKGIEAARLAYLQSLATLKQTPTDANAKQHTLALGRAYSTQTRDKKGNTLFDEVALMNDINAACAAAAIVTSVHVAASTSTSVELRLQTLTDLRNKGIIELVEYDKRRTEILSSI